MWVCVSVRLWVCVSYVVLCIVYLWYRVEVTKIEAQLETARSDYQSLRGSSSTMSAVPYFSINDSFTLIQDEAWYSLSIETQVWQCTVYMDDPLYILKYRHPLIMSYFNQMYQLILKRWRVVMLWSVIQSLILKYVYVCVYICVYCGSVLLLTDW